jgi:hypothetical protein
MPRQGPFVAVHVDDFLSAADSADENNRFKALLLTKWEIAELGDARFCLGIVIDWDRGVWPWCSKP